jgi:hypothetical protein
LGRRQGIRAEIAREEVTVSIRFEIIGGHHIDYGGITISNMIRWEDLHESFISRALRTFPCGLYQESKARPYHTLLGFKLKPGRDVPDTLQEQEHVVQNSGEPGS